MKDSITNNDAVEVHRDQSNTTGKILDAALGYSEHGLSVIPVGADKRPLIKWDKWQNERADATTIRGWFRDGANVAIVCGKISGGLLAIDFDEPRLFATWRKQVGELADGLPVERTPRGGYHVFLRCENPGGNQRLACVADESETSGRKVGIETRGKGGYVVVSPSVNGDSARVSLMITTQMRQDLKVHGYDDTAIDKMKPEEAWELLGGMLEARYVLLNGDLSAIPFVSQARADALLDAAGRLDECPLTRQEIEARATVAPKQREGGSVIDAYNAAHTINELLERHGYTAHGSGRYIRPNGEHASVTVKDNRSFHHNTNDALGDGYWHTAFDVFCKVEYGGDVHTAVKAAAQELGMNKPSAPSHYDRLFFDDCPALPDSARLPDGIDTAHEWLDAYIAFSRQWSPRSFEHYHEACGLWLLSTVAARRVKSDLGKERHTNLYIGLVGRTTHWVKSGAAEIGKDVLKQVGLSYLLLPDELTPQSFVNTLTVRLPEGYENLSAERQEFIKLKLAFAGQRGWWYDEFGRHLHKMMNDTGVYAEFRGLLRQLDNCPLEYAASTIGRGLDTIERPYLALLASLTPADMRPFARRGAALWNDGYFARFAFVASPSGRNPSRARYPHGQRTIPASIITPLHDWHERLGTPKVIIEDEIDFTSQKATGKKIVNVLPFETVTVALRDEVCDRFYSYHNGLLEIAAASGNDDVDGNYGRFAEKAFRIALLLASVEGASQIELRHWARAQQITERWRAGLHDLIEQLNRPEPSEAVDIEERIYKTVQKIGEATPVQVGYYNKNLSSLQISMAMEGMATAGRLNRVKQTKKKTWVYAAT